MSFILDALRKSEAARRRSEAPDLFAAMPATPEPVLARPNWPLWLLGAVAAISLIAVLWLLSQRTQQATPASPTVDATMTAAPTNDAATRDPVSEPVSAPIPEPVSAPGPASIPPQTPPPMDRSPPPVVVSEVAPQVAPLPLPARELPATPTVIAPPPALPPTGGLVSLADLDPATRKQLPPLKLSMHLWNETPARRFVILDGQRLREGDLLGELVIERITRDGAVLAWRGGQLRIELR